MKLSKLPILVLAAAALAGSGCSRDDFGLERDNYGTLSIALAASNSLTAGDITRAEEEEAITMTDALGVTFDAEAFITANKENFLLTITDSGGKTVYENKKLSDFTGDNALEFEIANGYTVEAELEGTSGFYGTTEADKGTPAYYGEATFNVTGGETPVEVPITVALLQSILKFAYTSVTSSTTSGGTATAASGETATEENMFDKYFSDWSVIVKQSNEEVAKFTKTETRGVLLEEGAVTIAYTLTPAQSQNEDSTTNNVTPITGSVNVDLSANTCHTFSFKLKDVGGTKKFTIEIDDEIADGFDIEIEDGIDLEEDQYQPDEEEPETDGSEA